MVNLIVLDVGPVRHIELSVHCESPFICEIADSALVTVSAHILSVQRVALGLLVQQLFRCNILRVDIRPDHTLAEALGLIRH